nr:hypothetical protein [Tanacetum cinerariifolium]
GAKRYGLRATGAAPGIRSIWNFTGRAGGRPGKFSKNTLGKSWMIGIGYKCGYLLKRRKVLVVLGMPKQMWVFLLERIFTFPGELRAPPRVPANLNQWHPASLQSFDLQFHDFNGLSFPLFLRLTPGQSVRILQPLPSTPVMDIFDHKVPHKVSRVLPLFYSSTTLPTCPMDHYPILARSEQML